MEDMNKENKDHIADLGRIIIENRKRIEANMTPEERLEHEKYDNLAQALKRISLVDWDNNGIFFYAEELDANPHYLDDALWVSFNLSKRYDLLLVKNALDEYLKVANIPY